MSGLTLINNVSWMFRIVSAWKETTSIPTSRLWCLAKNRTSETTAERWVWLICDLCFVFGGQFRHNLLLCSFQLCFKRSREKQHDTVCIYRMFVTCGPPRVKIDPVRQLSSVFSSKSHLLICLTCLTQVKYSYSRQLACFFNCSLMHYYLVMRPMKDA